MTGLNRDKARKVLADALPADPKWAVWVDGVLDQLEGCVQPQGIDRAALLPELRAMLRDEYEGFLPEAEVVDIAEYQAHRILALVQSVEGDVTWHKAEAVLDAIRACAPLNMELRTDPGRLGTEDPQTAAYVEGVHAAYDAAKQALAARLGASS